MTAVDERTRIVEAYARRDNDDRYDGRRADQVMIAAARARGWGAYLRRERNELGRVLEVGCGAGGAARWALDVGARDVTGVDVQAERLAEARRRNPRMQGMLADAQSLPIDDRAVDTVICSTLFSSVLEERVALAIASEIDRVLVPDGVVLWFDFFRDNPANPDVRPVKPSDLCRWFPGFTGRFERVVLAPPLARRLLGAPRVAGLLELLPPLRTHLVGGLRRI